jgi:hypothetical protein
MRVVLIALGLALGGYGVLLVWDNPWQVIINIGMWAAAGVVIHDFVFAPLCAAVGVAVRKLVRGRWWTPAAVAGLCTAVLALLAIPVYSKPGAHLDNMTVLDRNYPVGLWVSIAIVWACVPLYYLVITLLPVRQDGVVERQGPADVDGKPEAV